MRKFDLEKTHDVYVPLEDSAGIIRLIFTLTGTYGANSTNDVDLCDSSPAQLENLLLKYVTSRVIR